MKIIYIFIIISILFIALNIMYEKYINEPYITVRAQGGLNNRLRVILSYLYKANQEQKKLHIYWFIEKYCDDNFENLFEPINNVTISYIKNNSEYDFETWNEDNKKYIKDGYYSLLKPIPYILDKINIIKNKLGNNYIACHIRRTDALTHKWYKKEIIDDEKFIEFINQYPTNLKIYIATDCRITQQKFIDLYGNRMVYDKIEDNDNLRQTSIQDAVKDMYVCVDASYFKRSVGSFSDTIVYLRDLRNNIEK